jgi:hypothetical protein
MGINCFNQPDVESAKVAARELTDVYEKDGQLPPQIPLLCDGPLSVFITRVREQAFEADQKLTATGLLGAHLDQLQPGDYFALLAYLNRCDESLYTRLQQLRHAVRDRYRVATSLGYGPRYLHPTGQAHKGGPDTGLSLMITATTMDARSPSRVGMQDLQRPRQPRQWVIFRCSHHGIVVRCAYISAVFHTAPCARWNSFAARCCRIDFDYRRQQRCKSV